MHSDLFDLGEYGRMVICLMLSTLHTCLIRLPLMSCALSENIYLQPGKYVYILSIKILMKYSFVNGLSRMCAII